MMGTVSLHVGLMKAIIIAAKYASNGYDYKEIKGKLLVDHARPLFTFFLEKKGDLLNKPASFLCRRRTRK